MILSNPYVLAAIAVMAFVGGWGVRGWKEDASDKAAIEAAHSEFSRQLAQRDGAHAAQLKANEEREAALTARIDGYRMEADTLRAAIRSVPLVRTKVERVSDACSCSQSRLSSGFGVCFGAAISGLPEAAAACAASGGNAALPPTG